MAKSIAIIGAGAKAAAIVARAAVLKDVEVPTIHVIEKDHVGAAWTGNGQFSSGFLRLCTPAEKDVGFPYLEADAASPDDVSIASALFGRFSWSAYQVAIGNMSDWVDRGREHPLHRQWAEYLEWVFNSAGQKITPATVTRVAKYGERWAVALDEGGRKRSIHVDGVVFTGAGRPKHIPTADDVPGSLVFNSETFWKEREKFRSLQDGVVAIAGDGGAAGTIVAWLADRCLEKPVTIASISPMGTLFPRGDGYAERRWFSDPTEWPSLHVDDRRKLLERTEAGVISLRLKSTIDLSDNVQYLRGRAIGVRIADEDRELIVDIKYVRDDGSHDDTPQIANYFINAIGFDAWSLLDIVDQPEVQFLLHPDNREQRELVEDDMQPDLSLPEMYGVTRGLHIPSLAGFARGPGMGNLGCLGLMAKAVLEPYLS